MIPCRFDTKKCPTLNQCCLEHIEELKSYAAFMMEDSQLRYKIEGNDVYASRNDFKKVKSFKKFIEKHVGYQMAIDRKTYAYPTIVMRYSHTNRNRITIHFQQKHYRGLKKKSLYTRDAS